MSGPDEHPELAKVFRQVQEDLRDPGGAFDREQERLRRGARARADREDLALFGEAVRELLRDRCTAELRDRLSLGLREDLATLAGALDRRIVDADGLEELEP